MPTVVITGVETPLGRRVATRLVGEPGVTVLGLAGGPVVDLPGEVETRRGRQLRVGDAVTVDRAAYVVGAPDADSDGSRSR